MKLPAFNRDSFGNGQTAVRERGVTMIRVALLDEHELIRIGLKTVLQQSPEIDVVTDTGDPAIITPLIRRNQLDLLFVDASKRIGTTCPDIKIILMSTVFEADCLLQTLCGNAAGYLLKNTSPQELIAAVRAIACGGVYIHSALMAHFPRQLLRPGMFSKPISPTAPPLSKREQSVLDLLVKGYTNREVSEELFISPKTVESYRAKIYSKLGVKTRAGLFSCAVDRGLVAF
jgi:two-component system response regulator NreC